MLTRTIPSTGEALPVFGLGTWQTFNARPESYPKLRSVLDRLHVAGGRLIDTSPMYGNAEAVIGAITSAMPNRDFFFYGTKVWTRGVDQGKAQIADSFRLMKRDVMDLVQIHNLVDWQIHLPCLNQMKADGRLRYTGITHYQDAAHDQLAAISQREKIDFVQFNYSILSRHAEKMLLPLCQDLGVAVIINRPFGEGNLFHHVSNRKLPDFAKEMGVDNWGAFFLKYILANPAVTCVIPATGNPDHALQNLQAADGPMPDAAMRKKMIDSLEAEHFANR